MRQPFYRGWLTKGKTVQPFQLSEYKYLPSNLEPTKPSHDKPSLFSLARVKRIYRPTCLSINTYRPTLQPWVSINTYRLPRHQFALFVFSRQSKKVLPSNLARYKNIPSKLTYRFAVALNFASPSSEGRQVRTKFSALSLISRPRQTWCLHKKVIYH